MTAWWESFWRRRDDARKVGVDERKKIGARQVAPQSDSIQTQQPSLQTPHGGAGTPAAISPSVQSIESEYDLAPPEEEEAHSAAAAAAVGKPNTKATQNGISKGGGATDGAGATKVVQDKSSARGSNNSSARPGQHRPSDADLDAPYRLPWEEDFEDGAPEDDMGLFDDFNDLAIQFRYM
jgi:hypothetical protein